MKTAIQFSISAFLLAVLAVATSTGTEAYQGVRRATSPLPNAPSVTMPTAGCNVEATIVSSPNPATSGIGLLDVSALAPDDIWAVGFAGADLNHWQLLIEHWDGTRWTIVPGPSSPYIYNVLNSVEAITPSNVWAVGEQGDVDLASTLILHWDGIQWNTVASPNPGGDNGNHLTGLLAISANDIWAVGSYGAVPSHTLVIHWNGTTWTQVPSPDVGSYSVLTDISGTGADDIWAVGQSSADIGYQTLIMHWDGTQWNVVPSPNTEGTYDYLGGVVAITAADVWAVSITSEEITSPSRNLAFHWDGIEWSNVPFPDIGGENSFLLDVAASSTNDVWAVGVYGNTASRRGTIFHWDGVAWGLITTPDSPASILFGVEAIAPDNIWSVGGSQDGTLIEHIGRFSDVSPSDYFSTPLLYLAGVGAISGYSDCSFRPMNNATRGQISKMVVLAQGWTLLDPGNPTFADVPRDSPYYRYVETAISHGAISGYPCGNPEVCDPQSRPYFRPNADITRAQLIKVVTLAEGWQLVDPTSPTFADVQRGAQFYTYVETAFAHGVIGGYPCGNPEPCDPQARPLFRPANPATRGQSAKIVYKAATAP